MQPEPATQRPPRTRPLATLAPSSARWLGHRLGLLRLGRSMTYRDLRRAGGPSTQYAQQIIAGLRCAVTDEEYGRLARAVGMPGPMLADHLLRVRIMSALEWRGIAQPDRDFVWTGIEQRLAERGVRLDLDIARLLMASGEESMTVPLRAVEADDRPGTLR